MTTKAFPITQRLQGRDQSADAIFICIISGIGFALIPASAIGNIVNEKQKGLKHMQLVSGLSLIAYWLANLVFDCIKVFIPCVLTVGIIFAFDMGYESCWATILMYPIGVVPFSYAASFLFNDESTAQTTMLFSNVATGSIAGMAIFILRFIPDTMKAGDELSVYLKIFPNYSISNSIIYDGSKVTFNSTRTFARLQDDTIKRATLEPWELGNVGGDMFAMALHFVFGLFIMKTC